MATLPHAWLLVCGLLAVSSSAQVPQPSADDIGSNSVRLPPLISSARMAVPLRQSLRCHGDAESSHIQNGCTPQPATDSCGRFVVDDFLSADEVATLLRMVRRAVDTRSLLREGKAGPTIVDLNSGFLRDLRLQNIYQPLCSKSDPTRLLMPAVNYTEQEFKVYGDVFSRVGSKLVSVFNLTGSLYLTAPTFVTRIRGGHDWRPSNVHDEYYHAHADGVNTGHYQYSGLVYLSTHGDDFEGGKFRFYDRRPEWADTERDDGEHSDGAESGETIVEPRAGRLLLFTSGEENWHRVDKVASGDRFVFSTWFTCDGSHEFSTFLDGRAHTSFNAAEESAAQKSKRRKLGSVAALDSNDDGHGDEL